MKIIDKAIEIAERRGLNRRRLARAIGVDPSRITLWSQGTGFPDAEQIRAIALALDVTEPELTGLPPRGTGALWAKLQALLDQHGAEKCVRWIEACAAAGVPTESLPAKAPGAGPLVLTQQPPPPKRRRKSS